MLSDEFAYASIAELGTRLRRREISSEEIVKDSIERTQRLGSKLNCYIPQQDAGVARRLKQAGAILMGKANMNKFAGGESGDNPDFGRIKTPWNLEFSAGGSNLYEQATEWHTRRPPNP